MANTTYTVVKGDTLSKIASEHNTTVDKLVELNKLPNKNRIIVGQVLIVSGTAVKVKKNTSNKAIIRHFGLQSDTTSTIYATWTWDKTNTDKFEVWWYYDTGDGVWFLGNESTVSATTKQSTYSAPDNANRVQFYVRPVSKTRTRNGKESKYWSAYKSTAKVYDFINNPPTTPPTPTVSIDELKLTARLDNLDVNGTAIQFKVIQDDTKVYKTSNTTIKTDSAQYACYVTSGSKYKVAARAVRNKIYSDWSPYSSVVTTIPSAPTAITECKADVNKAVYLKWNEVTTADTYDIQYANKQEYLESSDQTTIQNGIEKNYYTLGGLELGHEYFFRVRAVNEAGESGWSPIKSLKVGTKPIAPTTWSSTTSIIVGEELNLYWVHNCEDGSSQVSAILEINLYDNELSTKPFDTKTIEIEKSSDPYKKDKTSVYPFVAAEYKEGVVIKWRVQTCGVTGEYGDWSILRTVNVYGRPTAAIRLLNYGGKQLFDIRSGSSTKYTVDSSDWITVELNNASGSSTAYTTVYTPPNTMFRTSHDYAVVCEVKSITGGYIMVAGSTSSSNKGQFTENFTVQTTGTHVAILTTRNDFKDCTTMLRTVVGAAAGENVKAVFRISVLTDTSVTSDSFEYISYDRGQEYITFFPFRAEVTAGPSSQTPIGYHLSITANDSYETTDEFGNSKVVSKGEAVYSKHFDVSTNPLEVIFSANNVDLENGASYTVSSTVAMDSGLVATSPDVEFEVSWDDMEYEPSAEIIIDEDTLAAHIHPYCEDTEGDLVEDVYLSVYRREFDGSFTEIIKNVDNTKNLFVTDPHPSLDYARYRIVATNKSTGSMIFSDAPAFPVGETAVVIQWDEDWSYFDTTNEDAMMEPAWSGSMLRLPYNIDVNDMHNADVALIEYIGRKRPVSYYGTQLGETSTWNVDIAKNDKETLYALRRLAVWMGDVYVREPSGSGYWANISVSFNQKHRELTIPVTLNIKRVEGGM